MLRSWKLFILDPSDQENVVTEVISESLEWFSFLMVKLKLTSDINQFDQLIIFKSKISIFYTTSVVE